MRITAIARLSRRPAKIFGSAAGSTTIVTHWVRGVRNERAVSVFTESTERTPSTVFISTGQTQANTMSASFIAVSRPNSTMKTGSSAGEGSARKNANSGPTYCIPVRERPSAVPSATPSTTAIAHPPTARAMLGRMSSVTLSATAKPPSPSVNHICQPCWTICNGVGK